MSMWIEIRKSGNFEEIGKRHNINPLIARILRNRNVNTDEEIGKYLHGGYKDLYDAHLLKDNDKAAGIIKEGIQDGKKIRIIGDYDIDGVESTYILCKGLRRCGADVDYAIPNRITDGYGINRNLIQKAYDAGVNIIITCDNGISAIDEVAYAKELGMKVIITDHHEIPYEEIDGERAYKIPIADAVVNPKQHDCKYPFKGLCGGAVAYKFIVVLYELFGIPEEESKIFLENAGFATVGDVMDLVDENRILVKLALTQLRVTKNLGMRALIEGNKLDYLSINSYHIGFILGPCINASGRLDTAKKSLELLLAKDEGEAKKLAEELINYNIERKDMTAKGVEQAIAQIDELEMSEDKVLVIYLPECHESIAGIIAGRIREKYYRPVFILTDAEDGVKGSGRSIEEYSMYDELVKCAKYLTKFGGHPMAAGLSLQKENIDDLRKSLNANCALQGDDMVEKIKIDAVIPVDYMSKELVEQLGLLEPCGKANTKPVFAAKRIPVTAAKIMGKNRNTVKLNIIKESGQPMEALYFVDADTFELDMEDRFGSIEKDLLMKGQAAHTYLNMLYYPSINEWMGRTTLQIVVKAYC